MTTEGKWALLGLSSAPFSAGRDVKLLLRPWLFNAIVRINRPSRPIHSD
jgi:hypothetical protein